MKSYLSKVTAISAMLLTLSIAVPAFAAETIVEKTGTLGLVGTSPNIYVSFIDESDSKTYILKGVWTGELKTLGGVKVSVRAMDTTPVTGEIAAIQLPQLTVIDYEIVDVGGGTKPFVGFLHMDGKKLLLHVRNFGVPITIRAPAKIKETLTGLVGSKMWMTGKLKAGPVLRLTRMNVIKKAEPAPASDTKN